MDLADRRSNRLASRWPWVAGMVVCGLVAVGPVRSAFPDGEEAGSEEGHDRRTASPGDEPFVSPLRGIALVDGQVPLLERKDAPSGRRYAVAEGASQRDGLPVRRFSGLVELDHSSLTPAERLEVQERKREENGGVFPSRRVVAAALKVGSGLVDVLADAAWDEEFLVLVRVDRSTEPGLSADVDLAVARGEVATVGDFRERWAAAVAAKQERVAAHVGAVATAVEELGGSVTSTCRNSYCLFAMLTAEQVALLSADHRVARIDLDEIGSPATDVNDGHVIVGAQIKQFIDDGYDGENIGFTNDLTCAIIDGDAPDDEHVGFKEYSGSGTRIRARYDCDSTDCDWVENFTGETAHATAVSGVLFGDLRDAQDPGVSDPDDRVDRSGMAGEAKCYLYDNNNWLSGAMQAFDDLPGRAYTPQVVNMSWTSGSNDDCLGEDSIDQSANELFENGLLLFHAPGNSAGSETDCSVLRPGSAIGVFTIGAHGNGYAGDEGDVRNDPIRSSSPHGGEDPGGPNDEGKGRTIIDLTAFGYRDLMYDTSGGYSTRLAGTSIAAPTVAGAALDFVDFYHHEYSTLIDNPGMLFVNMLQFGDRQGESGSVYVRFDRRWGAGRLQARKYDDTGMDYPWGFYNGWTCIDDGEEYTININSGDTLSDDVDYLKASIFWYDRRHESGTSIDDIDLYLRETDDTYIVGSTDWYDNKERVFSTAVGGKAVKLEIYGYSVTADDEGCGTNSMKVYYSYFYEDGDRDDGDGPGSEIASEE